MIQNLILHQEHPDWLIVEKPANLLVHPTKPDDRITLWHLLQGLYLDEALAPINRLDRETSGLVLVGRNREAASGFGKLMMERKIRKEYLVLVEGVPPENGVIEKPIDRISKYRASKVHVKQGIFEDGYPAVTKYELMESRKHFSGKIISKLKVHLETGRLHQIRVHLSSIGYPIVGDKIYGPDENCYLEFIETGWSQALGKKLLLPRHAVHAAEIGFEWKGEPYSAQSSFPEDLEFFWNSLD